MKRDLVPRNANEGRRPQGAKRRRHAGIMDSAWTESLFSAACLHGSGGKTL
ncbi:hypothetical protein HMPREF1986_02311 [Oribacterium sp. oral taxon 078 str. F0263]|nr:hypothetical protein HMPREF1986_02311 [Oribacterium sp. oral taxon 078 str. F0263]